MLRLSHLPKCGKALCSCGSVGYLSALFAWPVGNIDAYLMFVCLLSLIPASVCKEEHGEG